MRIYACDNCGAEFKLSDDDFDEICPECFSDQTVLISDNSDFEGCEDSDDEDY